MRGRHHPLHPETRRALAAARARRSCCSTGAAGRTSSPAATCGKVWECPQLRRRARAAPRRADALACHHCGHRERVPERCDACGSLSVARHGAGTERLEAELRRGARRARSSGSTPTPRRTRTRCPRCSRASPRRPTGLLLGTQMVAKGHDFPDVTLGVVLDADSTLRFPDFRAEERTFALIAQLAGRAGRGPGRRARARADPRPTRPRSRRGAPRRDGLPRRASSSAARRCATRRSPT